jgi:hypothetical protein
MIEPRRAGPPVLVALLALVLVACSGLGEASTTTAGATAPPSEAASSVVTSTPTDGATEAPATSPDASSPDDGSAAMSPAPEDGIPTACLTLADVDCLRARTHAADALLPTDPQPVYVQVGPFGCAAGDRCPPSLAARPEGDVTVEFADGTGVMIHVIVRAGGRVETSRAEAMGIAVEPSSSAPVPDGPTELALGHCGIFSGIDLGGSWWDPVGQVAMDTGAAVNATAGVFTPLGPDRATWEGEGLTLQLLRRDGAKLLPFCM